jgi:hypothetical protein
VAYLICLPLDFLMETAPAMEEARYEERMNMVPAIYFKGDRIWGATCRILLKLRRLLEDEKV